MSGERLHAPGRHVQPQRGAAVETLAASRRARQEGAFQICRTWPDMLHSFVRCMGGITGGRHALVISTSEDLLMM